MKLLSIVAGFALAQSACAALCEQGRYYCGREFKKFSNAGTIKLLYSLAEERLTCHLIRQV